MDMGNLLIKCLLFMVLAGWCTAPLSLQAKEHAAVYYTSDTNSYELSPYYENMPRFSGGKIQEWIKNHLIYPTEAFEANIEGKVYISLVIGADSLVHDVKVVRSDDTLLDKAAVEVIQKMPYWEPATHWMAPVDVFHVLPVFFKCEDAILKVADEMPVFSQPLVEWVKKKVRRYYKAFAWESSVIGKSYVALIIEKDGSVSSPEIVRSSGFRDIDEKALEIVRSMPPWKPGKHKGRLVRIQYFLPVSFSPF